MIGAMTDEQSLSVTTPNICLYIFPVHWKHMLLSTSESSLMHQVLSVSSVFGCIGACLVRVSSRVSFMSTLVNSETT